MFRVNGRAFGVHGRLRSGREMLHRGHAFDEPLHGWTIDLIKLPVFAEILVSGKGIVHRESGKIRIGKDEENSEVTDDINFFRKRSRIVPFGRSPCLSHSTVGQGDPVS